MHGAQRKGWIIQLLNTLVLSLLLTIFFFVIYYTNQDLLKMWLDDQLNPWITYGTGYYIMTLPFVWIAAAIIIFILDRMLTKFHQPKKSKHEESNKYMQ